MSIEQDDEKKPVFSWRRLTPLVVLGTGLAAFFVFDLDDYLTFETLKDNRAWLLQQVADSALVTALAFIGVYIVVVASRCPAARS